MSSPWRVAVGLLVLFALVVSSGLPEQQQALARDLTIDRAGFAFERINLDVSELNSALGNHNFPPLRDNMLLHGVTASGTFFDLFPYTAFAAGNALTQLGADERITKFSFSYGGFIPEFELLAEPEFGIRAGLMLGGGRATLMLLDNASQSFADAIERPRQTVLRQSFLSLKPQISAVAHITPWLNLNLSGGYLIVLSGGWEQHGNALPGPPGSLNSLTLQAALEVNWRA